MGSPMPTAPGTRSAGWSSAYSTSSGPRATSHARHAGAWRPRSTETAQTGDRSDGKCQLLGFSLLDAEPGNPYAQKAYRPWRVEGAQQLQRHPPDVIGAVHRNGERACPRVSREVVEPHLDAHGASAPLLTSKRRTELIDEPSEDLLQLRQPGDVAVEGPLARFG